MKNELQWIHNKNKSYCSCDIFKTGVIRSTQIYRTSILSYLFTGFLQLAVWYTTQSHHECHIDLRIALVTKELARFSCISCIPRVQEFLVRFRSYKTVNVNIYTLVHICAIIIKHGQTSRLLKDRCKLLLDFSPPWHRNWSLPTGPFKPQATEPGDNW